MLPFRRDNLWRTLLVSETCIFLLLLIGAPSLGAAGAESANLIPLGEEGYSPMAWFPDGTGLLASRPGRALVVSPTRSQQLTELWALSLNGEAPQRITDNGILPALSPDGRKLAYLSYVDGGKWSRTLHDFAAGREVQGAEEPWLTGLAPHWESVSRVRWRRSETAEERRVLSPDGRYVAGIQVDAGPEATLWIDDTRTGERQELLTRERWFLSPVSWSPDSRTLALSRTPPGTGNEGQICWLDVATGSITPITTGQRPLWSPDGRWIAFERAGRIWLLAIDADSPCWVQPESELEMNMTHDSADIHAAAQLVSPATIRVIHRADNDRRPGVPPGQIDLIPFEEYVKRVVPYEVLYTWPSATMKAQAMTARSYAWWFIIRHVDWDYDVSDWIDYQAMGDQTWPETNAAVEATEGQYIAHEGEVILAECSHQNSSPTVTRAGYPYMQAVDDPVSFGETRWGHGRGFSQEGGRRWAAWHNWTYEQILTHYYTGVTIERPANAGPPPKPPAGAVVRPLSGFYVTSDRVDIRANASDADGDLAGVDFYARWLNGIGQEQSARLGPATQTDDGWRLLWDISTLPDQELLDQTVIITGTARDEGGRTTNLATTTIGIDRQLPTGVVEAPAQVTDSTVPITASAGSAGASGMAGLLLSNDWVWEEGSFYYFKGTGAVESDPDALDGQAWVGRAGSDEIIYGPYTRDLGEGRPYRAIFRLKTNVITETAEIATLDVADNAGVDIVGLKRLRGIDFKQPNVYQEFGVDFWYKEAGASGLEFRIAYHGLSDLYFDRVLVAVYPMSLPSQPAFLTWDLPDVPGMRTVRAKFADNAGNLSPDQVLTIELLSSLPTPTPTNSPSPTVTPTGSVGPTVTSTLTPTASPTATATTTPSGAPTSTPTRTATPGGIAYITLSIGAIFADLNENGVQDAGELNLTDVRMSFLDETGNDVVSPTVGGSWHFSTSAHPGRRYDFVASRPGFRQRVEPIIAPDAGLEINLDWSKLPMHPWAQGALLPLIVRYQ